MAIFEDMKYVDEFSEKIKSAQNLNEIFALLSPLMQQLGFEHYAYWLVWPPDGPRNPVYQNTYPEDWIEHYAEKKYGADDLVMRYAANHMRPYEWSEVYKNYLPTPDQRLVINEGADAGLRAGATVPLFGPGQTRAVFSVSNDQSEREFSKIFGHHKHALHLLATFTHERILQLQLHEREMEHMSLSAREIEVLTWASRGKTFDEIATILDLSINTVKTHMQQACRRLGASSKTQAVVIAVMNRLILPL